MGQEELRAEERFLRSRMHSAGLKAPPEARDNFGMLCACVSVPDGESVPVKIAENTVESGGDVLQEM